MRDLRRPGGLGSRGDEPGPAITLSKGRRGKAVTSKAMEQLVTPEACLMGLHLFFYGDGGCWEIHRTQHPPSP